MASKSACQLVLQWMIEEISKSSKKGICAVAIKQFPNQFRESHKNNLEKARNWLNEQDKILEDCANKKITNSITSCQSGKEVRLQLKCWSGRRQKPTPWVN